jgi:2-polyprenyl-3-methyl-5-hydroxy-6-metoxy-1,4-benzoquinol methylase
MPRKTSTKNLHKGNIIDTVDGFDVIECRSCKFRHVNPIPTDQELSKLYSESFYRNEKPKYFKEAEEDYEWWMLTYKNYYKIFENYTKGRRLLDIGSGPGYFLKCGKEMGWDVMGFEPSKQAYEYSVKNGLNVINDFFTDKSAKPYGKYDVIFMSLVLEHLPNPKELIKTAKKFLKPKGILCIISPNDYNKFQEILKSNLGYKPWWVVPLQHINYFNFDSIQDFLKRMNFNILNSYGTFPMEYYLLSGDNYVANNKLGRKSHGKRKEFEKNLYLHNPNLLNSFYASLAQNKIGREFIILASPKK